MSKQQLEEAFSSSAHNLILHFKGPGLRVSGEGLPSSQLLVVGPDRLSHSLSILHVGEGVEELGGRSDMSLKLFPGLFITCCVEGMRKVGTGGAKKHFCPLPPYEVQYK
ncbi:hypothetical protein MHYP_G00187190 [Metynnis hypsauchen]